MPSKNPAGGFGGGGGRGGGGMRGGSGSRSGGSARGGSNRSKPVRKSNASAYVSKGGSKGFDRRFKKQYTADWNPGAEGPKKSVPVKRKKK